MPTTVLSFIDRDNMDIESTSFSNSQDGPSPNQEPQAESCRKVFETTELLEMILSFLPLPSLLRSQAVNKQWNTLIRDSSTLQQRLYFKPEKVEKLWLAQISNLPAQLPPLRRDFKTAMHVLAEVHPRSPILKTYRGLIATPVRVNKLFLSYDPFLEKHHSIDKKVDRGYVAEYTAPLALLQTIKQHSVRDMLLTKPPVTSLCVEVLVRRRADEEIAVGLTFWQSDEYRLYSAKLIEPTGVRLRQVAQALEEMEMLERAESIKIFMSGVVEVTEEDEVEVRKRTEEWEKALSQSS